MDARSAAAGFKSRAEHAGRTSSRVQCGSESCKSDCGILKHKATDSKANSQLAVQTFLSYFAIVVTPAQTCAGVTHMQATWLAHSPMLKDVSAASGLRRRLCRRPIMMCTAASRGTMPCSTHAVTHSQDTCQQYCWAARELLLAGQAALSVTVHCAAQPWPNALQAPSCSPPPHVTVTRAPNCQGARDPGSTSWVGCVGYVCGPTGQWRWSLATLADAEEPSEDGSLYSACARVMPLEWHNRPPENHLLLLPIKLNSYGNQLHAASSHA